MDGEGGIIVRRAKGRGETYPTYLAPSHLALSFVFEVFLPAGAEGIRPRPSHRHPLDQDLDLDQGADQPVARSTRCSGTARNAICSQRKNALSTTR